MIHPTSHDARAGVATQTCLPPRSHLDRAQGRACYAAQSSFLSRSSASSSFSASPRNGTRVVPRTSSGAGCPGTRFCAGMDTRKASCACCIACGPSTGRSVGVGGWGRLPSENVGMYLTQASFSKVQERRGLRGHTTVSDSAPVVLLQVMKAANSLLLVAAQLRQAASNPQ